jgi:hypothetical protein
MFHISFKRPSQWLVAKNERVQFLRQHIADDRIQRHVTARKSLIALSIDVSTLSNRYHMSSAGENESRILIDICKDSCKFIETCVIKEHNSLF